MSFKQTHRRYLRSALAAAAVGAMAFSLQPATAAVVGPESTTGDPGVGDPVFPGLGNDGYDVKSYKLDLRYDAEKKLVDGEVIIDAHADKELASFNLDSAGLTIHRVDSNGSEAAYTQEGEELVITPERPVEDGSKFRTRVSFQADPRKIPPPAGGWVANEDGFALAPQPAGAHTVFPSNDHPSDKADFTISVTAPKGSIGVASGLPTDQTTNSDGSTTTTYESQHPIATEVLQVVVGDYKLVDRGTSGDTILRDIVPTAKVDKLEPALALTPGIKDWIENHLGTFPLEAYGLLPVNNEADDAFDFTGLETQTLTLYKPKYLEQPENKIGSHMMHEIVHSWFGNSVSPKDWSALWFNEGHADLYGLMYRYERGWPDSMGYKTLEDRMKYTYSQGDIWRKQSGPVAAPNADNLFDNQRYTGAVLVLYALQEKIGAEKFKALEQTIISEYADDTIGTEDFIETAVDVTGDEEVRPFLEDWLYGTKTPPMPGHPDWTVDPPTTLRSQAELRTDHEEHSH